MLNELFHEFSEDYYDEGMVEPCNTTTVDNVQHDLGIYVYPIIVVLGLLGNLLVIVTYAFYKKSKSMTDVYLLNVAVGDVLFVVVLPLIIYNEQNNWAMGDVACKVLRGAYSLNLYSGMFLLGCISGDRYLAIVCASRSQYLRSRTLVYSHAICLVVWMMALLLSLPTIIYSQLYQFNPETLMVDFYQNSKSYSNITELTLLNSTVTIPPLGAPVCVLLFDETQDVMKILIPSLLMAIGFLLPLMVMAFCYTCVILTLLKARNFQRLRAVRVVLTVMLVFILCHLPYNLTLLVYTITLWDQKECSAEISLQMGLHLTQTLAFLHCCLNPFLYAFMGVRFRSHFWKVLQDLWCVGKDYMRARRPSSRLTSEVCLSTRRSVGGSNTENGTSFTV
ncbi:C-C chemokine receptor type 6-like [Clupea harengus]|uniref:C-C chemokine receptor type 6-like n=1 Tax=Clupea harengus TaxID=7950 RepID=A0A6P8GEN1_CLUHA|nr:C-C chemokine receptor type 6-like [Clupea harengus]